MILKAAWIFFPLYLAGAAVVTIRLLVQLYRWIYCPVRTKTVEVVHIEARPCSDSARFPDRPGGPRARSRYVVRVREKPDREWKNPRRAPPLMEFCVPVCGDDYIPCERGGENTVTLASLHPGQEMTLYLGRGGCSLTHYTKRSLIRRFLLEFTVWTLFWCLFTLAQLGLAFARRAR